MWASKFGTDYHERNRFEERSGFWYDVLGKDVLRDAWSVLEPGAGKGENLVAIRKARLVTLDMPMNDYQLTGIEVNKVAYDCLRNEHVVAHNAAFLDVPLDDKTYGLVITRGFLMHVPTAAIKPTLAKIYNASSRWICLCEYYSPVRREVEYHGKGSALWIDDFAGKIMEMYPDLTLVDYGFKYHKFDGYDLTYFLLRK
jgi:spore coat polysaccharide biosynthesis protein SpsF